MVLTGSYFIPFYKSKERYTSEIFMNKISFDWIVLIWCFFPLELKKKFMLLKMKIVMLTLLISVLILAY